MTRIFIYILLFLSVSILTISMPVWAEVRVKTTVTGTGPLKQQVEKSLVNALQVYKDIRVVDEKEDWAIKIIVTQATTTKGRVLGITMSILVLEPMYLTEENCKIMRHFPGPVYASYDHGLKTGAPGSVDRLCRELVTTINTRFFESTRKYKRFLDNMKK